MKRNDIEIVIRRAYAARRVNDPKGIGAIFAPDATFTDAGHPTHCSAAATYVGPQILEALKALCDNFHALNYEMRSLIIEGDRPLRSVAQISDICRPMKRYHSISSISGPSRMAR